MDQEPLELHITHEETHNFHDRCRDVIELAKWYICKKPGRKATAMRLGGVQSLAHDTWVRLATGKPVLKSQYPFTTVVCKAVGWEIWKQVKSDEKYQQALNRIREEPAEESYESEFYDGLKDDTLYTLRFLPVKELRIIKALYGIDDGKPLTLTETAKELGVTRERVRQTESKAIKRLQSNPRVLVDHLDPSVTPKFIVRLRDQLWIDTSPWLRGTTPVESFATRFDSEDDANEALSSLMESSGRNYPEPKIVETYRT